MKKFFSYASLLALLALLAACGGGGDGGTITGGQEPDDPDGVPEVASLEVLASSPTLPSDVTDANSVTIIALTRDEGNNVVRGATVNFEASSGAISPPGPYITDDNGRVEVSLSTGGDPSSRTITVTGSADNEEDAVQVNVIGTTLSISGPDALPQNGEAAYTISLADSTGAGVANQSVSVESSNGNSIDAGGNSSGDFVTSQTGQVVINLTATQPGSDTLSATTLGLTANQNIDVSNDSFAITAPAPGAEVNIGTNQNVTLTWQQGGNPVVGSTVNFASTRGTLSAASAVTNGSGQATVQVSAADSGPVLVTATDAVGGTATSIEFEFVATVAAQIDLQASPTSVTTGQEASVVATIRDPAFNLVKNKQVNFVLSDVTGGSLSVASAITDSQGQARTVYTGGPTPSAVDAVVITATVADTPTVTTTETLTVVGEEFFVRLGTGNTLFEPDQTRYGDPWAVDVTDADGNGVANSTVQVSILSATYNKGFYVEGPTSWIPQINATCPDEDVNRNGILDPGEDANGNGEIEAGNVALVAAVAVGGECNFGAIQGAGSEATVTTDDNGFGQICVFYPQEFANWLTVQLQARTTVAGDATTDTRVFTLQVLADDVDDLSEAPPGPRSPFGIAATCADPN